MKLLEEKLALFRQQSSDITDTIAAIARLIDVDTTEGSHSKRIGIIQRTVCEHFDLPLESMASRVRTNRYAHPRQIALFLSRELTQHSVTDIARAYRPDMDHSTVTFACHSVQKQADTSHEYRETIATLRARCVERIEYATMPLFALIHSKNC